MTHRTPFKFLDAYTQADRDIFFGRDAEIEELYARALQSRLLLVYGPSGVGKTSLIQCGLANQFSPADWLPLTIRYDGNLLAALDCAIAALAKTPISSDAPLANKLHSLYLDYFMPVTLIFDQLEELFIFGAAREREQFAAEIAALLDAAFKLRIILVIREEYLAELTAFETQLPDLFTNRLRVERMSHANVRRAIEGPCETCGVGVATGLADQIIARLGASKSGVIELTYLQVLLDKLYAQSRLRCTAEDPGADNALKMTLRDLEALGEIGDILGAFLNEQLAALPPEKAALGEAILKTLVTPEGTKKALNATEIAATLGSSDQPGDPAAVAALLNHFAAVRILSEQEASDRYELRHDSLAAKIFERMTALEKDLLEVIQTVENRYKEHQKRGTLLDAVALAYVAPYESRLRFNSEFSQFITLSRRELDRVRRRRRIVLSAALLAVFLVVSGLGIVSYFKYREAEEQRGIAINLEKKADEQRQRAEIEKNTALRTQSLFLADLARQENEKQNYANGILLALEALPKNMNAPDRPYVPEAELQLYTAVNRIREHKVLRGHTGSIVSATFSPDSTRLVTASRDGTARMWDTATGQEVARLNGHTADVVSAAFSPDGVHLVTASWDGTARVWDTETGQELSRLCGHTDRVYSAVFSPDGIHIFTTSRDKTARVWNTATGQEFVRLSGHGVPIHFTAFSPDGAHFVTASADDTVRVWDISAVLNAGAATGQEVAQLRGHTADVVSAVFNSDGTRIVTASTDDTARVWDVATGKEVMRLSGHADAVVSAAFSPDGTRIVTASEDGTARVWDISAALSAGAATGQEVARLNDYPGRVFSATFSPDGIHIATVSTDRTAKVWRVFPTTQELIDYANQIVPQRLTCDQRRQFFLRDAPCPDLEQAVELATQGQIQKAIAIYTEAKSIDPGLMFDPETEAKRWRAQELFNKGEQLAQEGKIQEAIAAYTEALTLDPTLQVSANSWNELCWFGSLWGQTAAVLDACEQAVSLQPDHRGIRDSRGVARALTNDFAGAIEDFEAFVAWAEGKKEFERAKARRQDWIEALRKGDNPFTPELLEALRKE